jgi:hypothetical protein
MHRKNITFVSSPNKKNKLTVTVIIKFKRFILMLNYVSKTHKILETSIFGITLISGFVPNNFVPTNI